MTRGNHFPTTPSRQSLKPSKSWLRVEPHGGGFRVVEARHYWDGFDWDDESEPSDDKTIYADRALAEAAMTALAAPALAVAA